MPILSTIGRTSRGARLLRGGIAAALITGAVAMVYPFLILLSGATKSAVDTKAFDLLPDFLHDDAMLYRKHVEGLFNERLADYQSCYDADEISFERVDPPAAVNERFVDAWHAFLQDRGQDPSLFAIGYLQAPVTRTVPANLRRIKEELQQRFAGDIDRMNAELGTEYAGWNAVLIRNEEFWSRRGRPRDTPWAAFMRDVRSASRAGDRYYFAAEGFYKALYLKSQYTRDIAAYNAAHGTAYTSYDQVTLARRHADAGTPRQREDWDWFVRNTLNPMWVRIAASESPAFREFVRAKYGEIAHLNKAYGTAYVAWDDVHVPSEVPSSGAPLSDWEVYLAGWKDPATGWLHRAAPESLELSSIEFRFRDHLRETHGTIDAANAALGTAFASWEEIDPPQREAHYLDFVSRRAELRWEFATRNFRTVTDYLLLHGRGIVNTVIFCALSILTALIVNPLAAYALSRYRLPSTYKILFFLLLTMAFPPMVTQIPNFLMLRDLGLLNTFAALVLPAMANGYSIFLLKGFFDSLPKELYESASIDGASEWTMFWHITMSLSRPILAVIALHAFTAAYASFMFALLICQDERMWTLMVWLYQLQSRSGPAVMYASLLVAAIPTFLVFFFCQRVIMRGIVVPVEK